MSKEKVIIKKCIICDCDFDTRDPNAGSRICSFCSLDSDNDDHIPFL